jgi:hypothetical protein
MSRQAVYESSSIYRRWTVAEETTANTSIDSGGTFGWLKEASGVSLTSGAVFLLAGLWLVSKVNEEDWVVEKRMIWFMFTLSAVMVAVTVLVKVLDAFIRDENYDVVVQALIANPALGPILSGEVRKALDGQVIIMSRLLATGEVDPSKADLVGRIVCKDD